MTRRMGIWVSKIRVLIPILAATPGLLSAACAHAQPIGNSSDWLPWIAGIIEGVKSVIHGVAEFIVSHAAGSPDPALVALVSLVIGWLAWSQVRERGMSMLFSFLAAVGAVTLVILAAVALVVFRPDLVERVWAVIEAIRSALGGGS